jgi:hypothetical protein
MTSTSVAKGRAPRTTSAIDISSLRAEMMTLIDGMPRSRDGNISPRMRRVAAGLWWLWIVGIHALVLWALVTPSFRF